MNMIGQFQSYGARSLGITTLWKLHADSQFLAKNGYFWAYCAANRASFLKIFDVRFGFPTKFCVDIASHTITFSYFFAKK